MTYPVHEIFTSIQGEGANRGRAVVFVRLAGCRVRCEWCDSPEAQTTAGAEWMSSQQLMVNGQWSMVNVVITGGEPTQYDLGELTDALHSAGADVWLETSGTELIRGTFEWICLSPKQHRKPLAENWVQADELKVVISSEADFEWAERCAAQVREQCELFLQPEWGARESITEAIVEYIIANPKWMLSLQTHKYIGVR